MSFFLNLTSDIGQIPRKTVTFRFILTQFRRKRFFSSVRTHFSEWKRERDKRGFAQTDSRTPSDCGVTLTLLVLSYGSSSVPVLQSCDWA